MEALLDQGSRPWKEHVGTNIAVLGCSAENGGSRTANNMVVVASSEAERIRNDRRHASRHLEPPQTVIQEA